MFGRILLAASCLCAIPALATTITISETLNSSVTDSTSYKFQTNGSGGINTGQTGFTGNPATASHVLTYTNYLATLPVGATITSAFLDFEAIFGPASISAISNDTIFYTPLFSLGSTSYNVSIAAAGAVTQTLNGSLSATQYDLFANGFASAITAGAPLSVTFSVLDVFAANTASYSPSSANRNKSETFTVTANRSVTGSNNTLFVDYTSAAAAAPEPASIATLAGGLAAFGLLARRRGAKQQPHR